MSLSSVIVGLPVIVTVADSAITFVPPVTNAAVTCAGLPVILIALVAVTSPSVFPPIALNSVAPISVPLPSLRVTVADSAITFVPSVTNAAVNSS